MGVTLAAVADDRDLSALDKVEIGVPIVINAHVLSFVGVSTRLRCRRGRRKNRQADHGFLEKALAPIKRAARRRAVAAADQAVRRVAGTLVCASQNTKIKGGDGL
jgi:hypothetical protein